MSTADEPLTLQTGHQRLVLLPELGGSVASWEMLINDRWQPMLRPWNRLAPDAYTFACFPLVPWSNRISAGGFTQDGVFYPIEPNRAGEPYPIHGDGWLQPWDLASTSSNEVVLQLTSAYFNGNPYHYRATQNFLLGPDGLTIRLDVTNLGERAMPFGLGLHPYFLHDANTRLQMRCDGLWLSGADPMPVRHTVALPDTFDYRSPAPLEGPMIDHCFTGWDGKAVISYPDKGFALTLTMPECDGYALMYRPPGFDYFCLEPITQPIDAFHMPERPGLRVLAPEDLFSLEMKLQVQTS